MASQDDRAHPWQATSIGYHPLGILYLVGHGHVFKSAFALSMTIEIKSQRCYAMCLQAIGQNVQQGTFLVPRESVTDDHQWNSLA